MAEKLSPEGQIAADMSRAYREASDEQEANNKAALELRAAELVREYGQARADAAKAVSEAGATRAEDSATAEKPEQFKVGANMGDADEYAFRDFSTDSKVEVADFGKNEADVKGTEEKNEAVLAAVAEDAKPAAEKAKDANDAAEAQAKADKDAAKSDAKAAKAEK